MSRTMCALAPDRQKLWRFDGIPNARTLIGLFLRDRVSGGGFG